MRFIDFLIFYFTAYFERNRYLLTWSTPLEKASYAVGLMSVGWMITGIGIFKFIANDKSDIGRTPTVLSILIAIILTYFLDYIYKNKNRYDYIRSDHYKHFKMKYKKGITLSIAFLFFSIIVPFILAIILSLVA